MLSIRPQLHRLQILGLLRPRRNKPTLSDLPSLLVRVAGLLVLAVVWCVGAPDTHAAEDQVQQVLTGGDEVPEALVGGRLFSETRFAQYFHAHYEGDVNAPLAAGDPVMDKSPTTGKGMPGPFAGESMNCRACHLVGEFRDTAGMRTYADFARRSPIPDRNDGQTLTARNAQGLVTVARPGNHGITLHNDGQFATMLDLVKGTFTGRNFGWLPGERSAAVHHIAKVIREDDGKGKLAEDTFGYSYAMILAAGEKVGRKALLPSQYKLDVATASDEEIFERVCQLVAEYVRSLKFQIDEDGAFSGSPYDRFLKKNGLPRKPGPVRPGLIETEADLAYARKLRQAVNDLKNPQWIGRTEGRFLNHQQEFKFGPAELAGLKIFLADAKPASPKAVSHAGNCIACHAPPSFSDFGAHNTGATQEEYDQVHGKGAFMNLAIPDLEERSKHPDDYLPASAQHPQATGTFEAIPDRDHPGKVDLGLWNVLFNPDIPNPQARLSMQLTKAGAGGSSAAQLDSAIARFKTPTIRDLGHSAPYLHNGSKDAIEDVLRFYIDSSKSARSGQMRNTDAEISKISIDTSDIPPLAAFLRSLNEDYDD